MAGSVAHTSAEKCGRIRLSRIGLCLGSALTGALPSRTLATGFCKECGWQAMSGLGTFSRERRVRSDVENEMEVLQRKLAAKHRGRELEKGV